MPPPIDEEEEDEVEEITYHNEASSSALAPTYGSDNIVELELPVVTSGFKAVNKPSQDPQAQPKEGHPARGSSPAMPLVVSDILPALREAAPAVPSSSLPKRRPVPDKRPVDTSTTKKRSRDVRWTEGNAAKRKRGSRRDLPCCYCVRRLGNDPGWVCHDALVSQDGNASYGGLRCNECVAAHVSCRLVPPKALDAVKALVKAAADVTDSVGTPSDKISLLATYEAAIGPALRATISPPTPKEAVPYRKKRNDKKSKSSKGKSPAHSDPSIAPSRHKQPKVATSGNSPWSEPAATDPPHRRQQQQPQPQQTGQPNGVVFDPASLFSMPSPQPARQHAGDADLDKLERLALRRRKVEAIESLAHTAALFLAEYVSRNNREPERINPAGGAGRNDGVDYAAAAAGMATGLFQSQPSEDRDCEPQLGLGVADLLDDSDSDGSDAETVDNTNRQSNQALQDNSDVEIENAIGSEAAGQREEDEEMFVPKQEEDEGDEGGSQHESEVKAEGDD